MAGVNIREARKADAKKIFELMQQQAAEQNTVLPSQLTPEVLAEAGWGPAAVVVAFVAESKGSQEGELAGYLLAHRAYSTWHGRAMFIKDAYVVPAARRSGVATRLCRELMQAAVSMGCNLCFLKMHKENRAAVDFFEKLGAENITKSFDLHFFSLDFKLMAMETRQGGRGRPQVRLATPDDNADVKVMLKELAEYENIPYANAPQLDAHDLVTGSSPQGTFFECIVAESDGELVGFAMFCPTFSHHGLGMFLATLYVKPAHRGHGLGSALMAHVAQRGVELGGSKLEVTVQFWNTPSVAFYKNKGATDLTADTGLQYYRIDAAALRKCANDTT